MELLMGVFIILLFVKILGLASDLEWKWVFFPLTLMVIVPAVLLTFFFLLIQFGMHFG